MSLALPAAPPRSDNIRGILAMLASMAVFVINDLLMKIAAGHLPTGEAIFLRGGCLQLLWAPSLLSPAVSCATSDRRFLRPCCGAPSPTSAAP